MYYLFASISSIIKPSSLIDDIEANTSYINSGLSVYSVSLSILNNKLKEYQKWILVILINIIAFPTDFSSIAVMSILSMYSARGNLNKQMKAMMLWVS